MLLSVGAEGAVHPFLRETELQRTVLGDCCDGMKRIQESVQKVQEKEMEHCRLWFISK